LNRSKKYVLGMVYSDFPGPDLIKGIIQVNTNNVSAGIFEEVAAEENNSQQ
jgi:hypothetical protein